MNTAATLEKRKLGKDGPEVSIIGLGCWQFAGAEDLNWGQGFDEQNAIEIIKTAYESGINFFDTAEGYGKGNSERLLGKAFKELGIPRDKIVIASKVLPDNLKAEEVEKACERSLQNLGTDYIDLYQIHWPNPAIPIAETLAALKSLKERGKILHYGVSNFGPKNLDDLLSVEYGSQCVSNQLHYNLLTRGIEFEVQPKCVKDDISILCYCGLAQGLLSGKFRSAEDVPVERQRTLHFKGDRKHARHGKPGCEKETFEAVANIRSIAEEAGVPMVSCALSWLTYQPGVGSILFGAKTPEQVKENVAAITKLSEETLRQLSAASNEVKEIIGSNIDMWAEEPRAS